VLRCVPVDGGGHEDEVGTQQLLHVGQGDGGGFVDNDQLGLAELVVVLRVDVLDGLSVGAENVHSDDGLVELGVG
jgi:hypothetical protein